jgi:hypothetical protein
MFLGSRAAAAPYVVASKAAYFLYFLTFVPFVAALGEELLDKQTVDEVEEAPFAPGAGTQMYGSYS